MDRSFPNSFLWNQRVRLVGPPGWRRALGLIILVGLTGCGIKVPIQFDSPRNAKVYFNDFVGRENIIPFTTFIEPNSKAVGFGGDAIEIVLSDNRRIYGKLYVIDSVTFRRDPVKPYVLSISESHLQDIEEGRLVKIQIPAPPPDMGLVAELHLAKDRCPFY